MATYKYDDLLIKIEEVSQQENNQNCDIMFFDIQVILQNLISATNHEEQLDLVGYYIDIAGIPDARLIFTTRGSK